MAYPRHVLCQARALAVGDNSAHWRPLRRAAEQGARVRRARLPSRTLEGGFMTIAVNTLGESGLYLSSSALSLPSH